MIARYRLGTNTTSGVVTRRLTWVCGLTCLVVLLKTASLCAQISPGPLAKAHRIPSGPTTVWNAMLSQRGNRNSSASIVTKRYRARLAQWRGLHPSLVGTDETSNGCVKCHSDHNGVNFELVHWDTPVNAFDHRRAGYLLERKHARLTCRQCHQSKNISAAAEEALPGKDFTAPTWACRPSHRLPRG